ncbi:MAG TPA: hypothetical protein VK079_05135 [Bacillota bacterium]|nr:hypothetical protein [Bacillota bacterium]
MMTNKNHSQHIYDLCKDHMHAYVLVETNDGSTFDGIITGLDDENVYFAIPTGQGNAGSMPGQSHPAMSRQQRQFIGKYPSGGYGPGAGYGYGGYGGYGPGYYNYPPRRFDRLILPLAALTALTILPWY